MATTGAVVAKIDVYRNRNRGPGGSSRLERDRGGSSRLERYKAFISRASFVCVYNLTLNLDLPTAEPLLILPLLLLQLLLRLLILTTRGRFFQWRRQRWPHTTRRFPPVISVKLASLVSRILEGTIVFKHT